MSSNLTMIAIATLLAATVAWCAPATGQEAPLANIVTSANEVVWHPVHDHRGWTLSVSKPDGEVYSETLRKVVELAGAG